MAKKKNEGTEIVTFTTKTVNGDVRDNLRWQKDDNDNWVNNRQGIMSDKEFQDELKRMEGRDDVTVTRDTV